MDGSDAVCLYHFWCDGHEGSVLPEAENLCLSVIDNCRDEAIRHDAITTLSSIYAKTKKTDKALELIDQLAPKIYPMTHRHGTRKSR